MVVDVLQRAVLGKAREIHCLPLMSSRCAAGTDFDFLCFPLYIGIL